jgi:hypothetical protein
MSQVVRTDLGDWLFYQDRSDRKSAITYRIGSEIVWDGDHTMWPSINTPYGVFPTAESRVQSDRVAFEWTVVTHSSPPDAEPGWSRWATNFASKCLQKDIPKFVLEKFLGSGPVQAAQVLGPALDLPAGFGKGKDTG